MIRSQKGQSVVELALVLPIFLFLFLAIIDFGITLHIWSTLNEQCVQAARSASKRQYQLIARNLFTSTTHETLANVQNTFWFYQSPLMASSSYQNIQYSGVGTTASTVTILAEYNVSFYTPFINSMLPGGADGNGRMVFRARATERKE